MFRGFLEIFRKFFGIFRHFLTISGKIFRRFYVIFVSRPTFCILPLLLVLMLPVDLLRSQVYVREHHHHLNDRQ